MKLHALRNDLITVAAGSLMVAFGASAGDDPMMKMDTDRDGMVSAAEYEAGARSKWSTMDADGDGRVGTSQVDSEHQALDADQDGTITAAEHDSGSRSMFLKLDTDGDGSLSASELQAGSKPTSNQPR